MSDSARERWVRQEVDALAPILEPLGYTADECLRLAMLLYDMDVDGPAGGLSPEQQILRELVAMQGIDGATATILAQTMPRLDWGRIEIASRVACELLGVSRNSLLENMLADRVPAWNVLMSGDRQDAITFGLARILYTHAWRRRHPQRSRSVSSYPPPEYNAARFAIAKRRRERAAPSSS